MTPESVQAMIDQALLQNSTNGDGSHSSHGDNRRNVQTTRPCFYTDFMKCQPLNFKGNEGVVGLTWWIKKMELVFNISGYAIKNQVKFATCTLLGAALTLWNSQIRTLGPDAYSMTWEYLQHEHYTLWEVIKFGDSYKVPPEEPGKAVAGEASTKKKGRTVAITTEDIKYDNAKELWEAILKTFGGNEATKKTKKNQLKQQYGNFKAKGSETLEQTFNRLQAIVSHLEFMDVPIEKYDLNQKFLTSLAPEWLMYTIVWRNRDDLDTMSLDDLYDHLKVYKPEVQKKVGSNSQNLAFISSSNTSSRKGEVPTASIPTASSQVSTVSIEVAAASLSHDTICAYIATQSSGSQIKYEDITQIDEDDIEEMDIKWNLALLRMRADWFWKKTGKKITIQGFDVAGFDKSKVEH
ncbi:hypothetical protein Tco_1386988 [Tanacetum coccineum]